MTKTRKQIIELIEPFMDKTLSDTCLIQGINVDWYIEIRWKLFLSDTFFIEQNGKRCKILWHYDITAVLKYIENNKDLITSQRDTEINWIYEFSENSFLWIDDTNSFWWKEDIEIPNKPLVLYTDQEEKDLLELLQKLWVYQNDI